MYGKNSEILMGWELKMPDTQVTDKEFIENAVLKANILGLNSFLLWNVGVAVLYAKRGNGFQPLKTWNSLKSIATKREEVVGLKKEWRKLLHDVLKDLNNFFDDGEIEKKTFIKSFKDSTIIDFILRNSKSVANDLQKSARLDIKFSAEANIWWRVSKLDYPKQNQWEILSNIILVNWINKFLFAHILIAFFDPAKRVEAINANTSVEDAINVFQQISAECNFWNIFQPQLGEKYLNDEVWSEIQQLNTLLNDIELSSIGQELLQDLLQNIIYSSKRKVAGQYTTPMFLARLLTGLTMSNLEQSLHDPCCGTGTIARAAYDLKKESGIESKKALESIFSSDKVAFPLQMATIALSEPMNIGEIIKIFKEDCTKITKGNKVEFKDPYTGKSILKEYLGVDYIATNLPFIKQEDLKVLNPNIEENTAKIIKDYTKEDLKLNAKSDLYAYIPFYLWNLLNNNGRLGIITSNSWLGTEWGESYRAILNKFFHIEYVIISGKGRWFQNTDVVTTILILNKKNSVQEIDPTEMTYFITIETDLQNKENREIQEILDNIIAGISGENVKVRKYKTQDLFNFELNWGALFSNVSWLSEIKNKVIPASTLFEINRGERRGWDYMFYPENEHGIESEYIKPILKSSREIESLTTSAESEAFCCSKSIEELKKLKHKGALNWIKKFEHEVNGKNKPLPETLKRSGNYWYGMNNLAMADLVASINFDKRIFIAKLNKRSFVNQRLTRFTVKNSDIDIDLAHALLNSTIGIFLLSQLVLEEV
ncbi:MAG: N-6 DNA methylase [Candidatus Humimicrobiaceae bacterium]